MDYYEDGTWTGGSYRSRGELRTEAELLCAQIEAEKEKQEEIRMELEVTEARIAYLREQLSEVEELLA